MEETRCKDKVRGRHQNFIPQDLSTQGCITRACCSLSQAKHRWEVYQKLSHEMGYLGTEITQEGQAREMYGTSTVTINAKYKVSYLYLMHNLHCLAKESEAIRPK